MYEGIDKLKNYFKDFEDAHDKYHAQLTNEQQQDESETYFLQVQTNYITALSGAKKWLRGQGVVFAVKNSKVKAEQA